MSNKNANTPSTTEKTESDHKAAEVKTNPPHQSSHDNKSHTKAGTDHGVGGGKKQERKH